MCTRVTQEVRTSGWPSREGAVPASPRNLLVLAFRNPGKSQPEDPGGHSALGFQLVQAVEMQLAHVHLRITETRQLYSAVSSSSSGLCFCRPQCQGATGAVVRGLTSSAYKISSQVFCLPSWRRISSKRHGKSFIR